MNLSPRTLELPSMTGAGKAGDPFEGPLYGRCLNMLSGFRLLGSTHIASGAMCTKAPHFGRCARGLNSCPNF